MALPLRPQQENVWPGPQTSASGLGRPLDSAWRTNRHIVNYMRFCYPKVISIALTVFERDFHHIETRHMPLQKFIPPEAHPTRREAAAG